MKKWILLIISPLIFIACEDDAINNYNVARNCLDHSTAATAQSCVAGYANDNSQRANKLKCAAGFIEQGLDNDRLAEVFSEVQGSTESEFNNFATFMIFKGSDPDNAVTKATTTYNACNGSGSVGMAMFGSISYSATLMAKTFGGWDGSYNYFDPNGANNDLDGIGAGNDEELGNAALNIQEVYCANVSTDDDLCVQMESIIGGSTDPNTVGAAFRSYIDNG